MHIMMIANDTTFIYNLRREVLQAFLEKGYRVTVVAQVLRFREELEAMGCRIVPVQTGRHGTNPLADLALLAKYHSIIRDEKPDLVLTNNIKPCAYGGMACRITKTRYMPNITGLGTAVENPGKLQRLTIQLYKTGTWGAECIFFQNSENLRFFKEKGMLNPKARTILLPGSGVSLDAHPVLPYPEDGDKTHFLFVARLLKEKGIDLYLEAAKAIHKKYPNTLFHICGGCDDAKYLEIVAQAEKDGGVEYHGEQKNMLPFFEMAHCLVHPSYYPEGMSNVLLEAAASGRPAIATDRAGCRETVGHGVSGFVIPIKNQQALNESLETFMQMSAAERKDMGLAGRAKVEREFDRKIVVAKYLEQLHWEEA